MEESSIFMGERLLEIEAVNGLFDLTVGGIHLWQYVRYNCLIKILEEVTGIGMSYSSNKPILLARNQKFTIGEWIKKQQFLVHKKDLLVINHPRRVKDGEYYKCVITDTILENLKFSYYVYEYEYKGVHFNPVKTRNLKYVSMNMIAKKKVDNGLKYNRSLKEFIDQVIKRFEASCEIKFSKKLRVYIVTHIKNVFYTILLYRIWADRILGLVQPKAVMVTIGYIPFVQVVIAEAKRRRIPTIELQHGRIGDTHLAYNYKYQGEIESFADYMFVYGEYEKEVPRYPINKKNVIAVGYPELEKKAFFYMNQKKKRKQKVVVFISGPSDGEIVARYAMNMRQRNELKNVRMVYKLHPAEYDQWRNLYPALVNSGLEIVSDNRHDVYYYLGNSDYVVGISSTVLFEATMFRTKIFIIRERDYRKTEALYQYNMAELITSQNELAEKILVGLLKDQWSAGKTFFEKNSIENIRTALEMIIKQS